MPKSAQLQSSGKIQIVSAFMYFSSQAAWEGLLHDLYRRGLEGRQLQLIVTDGCAGLAGVLQTVYPRVAHQRCRVHKLRNLLGAVRRRDPYPSLVTRLLRDLPELLTFFQCPGTLWRKLRTTNVIERCFVEVRRRPARWCVL
ncbi:MAG: transposase [Nitrospiraceae bacterium]